METQVANAHDDVRPGFSRSGAKGKFVRIVTTPQGRYTTNLDKNTRAPIEGGKGYVMVDPAQYITPKRVRVQGTKGEIEVRAVLDGKEIVGVSAKLVSARTGVKAAFASPDDIINMAQLLSRVESAFMNKRMDEARKLLKQIAPIVDRNRGDNELDSQGMVRAFNNYKQKLGMSRPGAKAKA
jgi:hypothetical protein